MIIPVSFAAASSNTSFARSTATVVMGMAALLSSGLGTKHERQHLTAIAGMSSVIPITVTFLA